MLDIAPVLDFVARTGEHCVFFNPEDRGFFVVMGFKDYERMNPKRREGLGGPMAGGRVQSQDEAFVEPWATTPPSFAPEPPV